MLIAPRSLRLTGSHGLRYWLPLLAVLILLLDPKKVWVQLCRGSLAIVADAPFCDKVGHNYQLPSASPAIGAGNISYAQPLDLLGPVRPLLLGAFEVQDPLSLAESSAVTGVATIGSAPRRSLNSILAAFFAANRTSALADPPNGPLSIGTQGHPVQLAWCGTEYQGNRVYDWSKFDTYVSQAPAVAGDSTTASIIITLGLTPAWALSNQATCTKAPFYGGPANTCCTDPPDNNTDWTNFVTDIVNRYNNTAGLRHIRFYEIWNEWTNQGNSAYWTGTIAQLVTLAQLAYPIIKGDSHSLCLAPSVSGKFESVSDTEPSQMAQYLDAGGSQYADGLTWHGFNGDSHANPFPLPTDNCSYIGCRGSVSTQISVVRSVADNHGMVGKPLYDTEGGYMLGTCDNFEGGGCNGNVHSAWIAQWLLLHAGLSAVSHVLHASFFTWGTSDGYFEGTSAGTLGPAGTAWNQVYAWTSGALPRGACSVSGTTWTCNFLQPGGHRVEAIWDSSQTCSSSSCTTTNPRVPSIYTQYLDIQGDPPTTIVNRTVPVGLQPVLLE